MEEHHQYLLRRGLASGWFAILFDVKVGGARVDEERSDFGSEGQDPCKLDPPRSGFLEGRYRSLSFTDVVSAFLLGAIKSEMTQSLDWLDQNFEADGSELSFPGSTARSLTNSLSAAGKHLAAQHMLGRFGVPAEVANVVLLLAGNEGSFLTGQEWVVDGGLHRS